MRDYNIGKMGWRPDGPSMLDYNMMTPEVSEAISPALAKLAPVPEPLPTKVDLRKWSSPIESQELQDCCGNAGTSLMETFYIKRGIYLQFSRRFLYKVTRNLMGLHGDTGATIRDTMRALARFGVPVEGMCVYNPLAFDDEPNKAQYAAAENHQALVYYRLDPPGQPASRTVTQVKRFLAAELPSMLGFTVYSSIPQIGDGKSGNIPFFKKGDKILGYHAVKIDGYDDDRVIGPDTGAYLIANSWSTDWGDQGYGWMPYRYVLESQALDIWSMVLAESGGGNKPT